MNTATTYNTGLYYFILLILLPVLLISLGAPVLIDDEALRALVGLEMKFSGNYVAPTLNGEWYYKKPPLYNWLLLSFFGIAGTVNEWTVRIPTVVFLLAYAGTIFYFFKQHLGRRNAFLAAMMMVTCGRMLFYDSMLGLIDTCYSWVTFTSFMIIFHQFQKGQWLKLFVLSYLLAAIGFLMKGLPSVVFQGFTLLAYFAYRKKFYLLFRWQHITGGMVFLLVVGGYYLIYHQYNSLENVFSTLLNETTKRTVANYSIWRTIGHFASFPFELIYHFLPWTLLLIYFFRKKIGGLLRQNDFIIFCIICFLANIIVYWTAPKIHPRYLFMLMPLVFGVLMFLHNHHKASNSVAFRILYYLFGGCITLVGLSSLLPLWLERTQGTPFLYLKVALLLLLFVSLALLYWQKKAAPLLVLVAVLLVVRLAFDWFVIPDRIAHDFGSLCRSTTKEAAVLTADAPIAAYKETEMQPTTTFYLMNIRQEIVPIHFTTFDPNTIYIIDPGEYPGLEYDKITSFKVRHGKKTYHMGKLKSIKSKSYGH
jgi:hypothetical protein